jgi:hypothetical protein
MRTCFAFYDPGDQGTLSPVLRDPSHRSFCSDYERSFPLWFSLDRQRLTRLTRTTYEHKNLAGIYRLTGEVDPEFVLGAGSA